MKPHNNQWVLIWLSAAKGSEEVLARSSTCGQRGSSLPMALTRSDSLEGRIYNPLKEKYFHGVLPGNRRQYSLKSRYGKASIQYHLGKPPKALLQARLDNIAIVPASMLPFGKTLQQMLSNLPEGAVFLCHAKENSRQRKLLERVGEVFKAHGHVVTNLPMEQVV